MILPSKDINLCLPQNLDAATWDVFLYYFTLTLIIHIINIYISCEISINFQGETLISIGEKYPRNCI